MTVQKAYEIVKQINPRMVAVECLEFPDFYAFALVEKEFEKELSGGGYNTVNKITGEVGVFNPTQDFESFFEAKSINIDTLN